MSVSYDSARSQLERRLGDTGLAHSLAVAETAALLAGIYGVDVEKARLAGLLHDWDRELSGDELVLSATDAGLDVSESELDVPYLLHARTGAVDAQAAFPDLDEEVVRAIARHTTGEADMTELDMIVYVADMIEPHRSYAGVDDLRESAGSVSLGELFASAYQHSLEHLIRARKHIHPATLEVWNTLVARGSR